MAKTQFPIDGVLGKQFKVTSEYGWRIHPVEKTKKHHNGTDLWSANETTYIEAFHDGKVLYAGASKTKKPDGEPGGFGYYVVLLHKIDGKFYTSCYAHMKKGSIKVKVGQKVEAGTVLGIMGTTGMSTGRHLHWEIWVGKTHGWTNNGKGFVNPIDFTKALIAKEKALAAAPAATPDDAPVQEAPTHDEAQAAKVEAARQAAKVTVAKQDAVVSAPVTPAAVEVKVPAVKPVLKGELRLGSKNGCVSYLQKALGVAVTGVFDRATHVAVIGLQNKHADITLKDGIVGPITWSKIK